MAGAIRPGVGGGTPHGRGRRHGRKRQPAGHAGEAAAPLPPFRRDPSPSLLGGGQERGRRPHRVAGPGRGTEGLRTAPGLRPGAHAPPHQPLGFRARGRGPHRRDHARGDEPLRRRQPHFGPGQDGPGGEGGQVPLQDDPGESQRGRSAGGEPRGLRAHRLHFPRAREPPALRRFHPAPAADPDRAAAPGHAPGAALRHRRPGERIRGGGARAGKRGARGPQGPIHLQHRPLRSDPQVLGAGRQGGARRPDPPEAGAAAVREPESREGLGRTVHPAVRHGRGPPGRSRLHPVPAAVVVQDRGLARRGGNPGAGATWVGSCGPGCPASSSGCRGSKD